VVLRQRVRLNLVRIVLIHLSVLGLMILLVRYDLSVCTAWILHPTVTKIMGWLAALYGLFWIVWWFFWTSIEGGSESINLYGVTWAPITDGLVATGPFAWCRYPLAFGYLEFVWGLGFLVQSTTTVLKVVPIAVLVTVVYLRLGPEKRKRAEYGTRYVKYQKSTHLFLPRIPDSSTLMHLFDRRKRKRR